ncbi:gliding motility-associated C-terminal domain-containing protein, partial [uncultured Tenacibaculum sp.]
PTDGTISVTNGTNGVVVVTDPNNTPSDPSDDVITYEPNSGFTGTDTFTYTVCNNVTPTPNCDTSTVTVTVESPEIPDTEDDIVVTIEEIPIEIDIFGNDIVVPSDGTISVSDPSNGVVVVTDPNNTPDDPSDDVVTYEPNEDFIGTDTFTYTVCNNASPVPNCETSTVTITVEPEDITVVNEFSPNGDTVNDYLTIAGIEKFPNNTVEIFNRWGNTVYKMFGYRNDDATKRFEGESNGRATIKTLDKLPVGTYYYVIDLGDGSAVKTGWIYINR